MACRDAGFYVWGLRRWLPVIVVGPGAAPGQLRTADVGLVLALGSCPQIGAQLIALAGGLGAELVQHVIRVAARPLGLGMGGCLRCLCASGLLLRLPGPSPPRRPPPGGLDPGRPRVRSAP